MKIDFHTHTYYSYDSLMSPKKILKIAKERNLNGIVICDHNTIKGGLEVKKLNTDKNFLVIVGAEIATNAGDVTGLFLKEEIISRNIEVVIKEIKNQGGFVLLNHPYKGHKLELIDFNKIDFIEGYNSRLDMKNNKKAIELAKNHNIPILAGSDSHLYNEIGNCYSFIEDMNTLRAMNHHYKKSNFSNITISQYIKSYKNKNPSIFISATKIFIKKILSKSYSTILFLTYLEINLNAGYLPL